MIVFTDLDGTLLDHETYDFAPALPALTALAERDIPVILASSKTAPEIRILQDQMGLRQWPAIVENGAGLIEGGQALPDSTEYDRLRKVLDQVDPGLRACFAGFGDVGVEQVAAWTGLSPDAAALACQRSFTEPGRFAGSASEQEAFIKALAKFGVSARAGGRFLTLSFGATKADGLCTLGARFVPPTIALGDAPNDRDMLLAADRAVIIRNDHGPDPGDIPGALHTELPGPQGWNAAILAILEEQEGR